LKPKLFALGALLAHSVVNKQIKDKVKVTNVSVKLINLGDYGKVDNRWYWQFKGMTDRGDYIGSGIDILKTELSLTEEEAKEATNIFEEGIREVCKFVNEHFLDT
jgi:hypothetical protein